MSCAYCIHSAVKISQGVRNPWLKDTNVFVWKQHTTDDETTQRGSSVQFRNDEHGFQNVWYSDKLRYFCSQNVFMQIMYLQVKLIVYWTWRGTEFSWFTLKFQYSQCDVMLMFCFFKLYCINSITLIIRVICLRLSNAICGSNFGEKMCMRLKKIDSSI